MNKIMKRIAWRKLFAWMVLAAVLQSAQVFAADDVQTPKAEPRSPTGVAMAQACAGCHGTHGKIEGSAFVPLAGMPEAVFIKTMLDFRNDKRPATLMGHVAKGFSEAEIALMATYFAQIGTDDASETAQKEQEEAQ